jgi:VanZ family protein
VNSWWLPLTHRRVWTVFRVALVALVVYGSLAPGGVKPMQEIGDKWQHATSYFVLAGWFAGLAPRRNYPWVASGLLLLGLTLELLQYALTPDRIADPRDMVANTAGIFIGLVAACVGLGTWALRVEAWLARDA